MKNRIEERSCIPRSLSVWITNNNHGVTSFLVEIKRRKKERWGEIYRLRYFFFLCYYCYSLLILEHLHSDTVQDRLFFNQLICCTKWGGSKNIILSQLGFVLYFCLKIHGCFKQNWIIHRRFKRLRIEFIRWIHNKKVICTILLQNC